MKSSLARRDFLRSSALAAVMAIPVQTARSMSMGSLSMISEALEVARISGLTGTLSKTRVVVPTVTDVSPLAVSKLSADINLKRMAAWAMNYLIQTPRKELGYEPVFQCHPYACPPIPQGQDPVVACDTDARMDWEWYYMREITGTEAGKDVEAAFHNRIRSYIAPDGKVWSHPGSFNEGDINARYAKADYVVHIWGATKILNSLAEDYARTRNPESKTLARKVMLALRSLATTDKQGRAWFAGGMGAWKDGKWLDNGWNKHPAPIIKPLVRYWQVTGDEDGLAFARAYAAGILDNCQPGGIRFKPDGSFDGHSHATMHAVWGVAELGVEVNEPRYIEFAQRAWDWMLTRGTGTGWFPAGPDNCNETCCVSDMMSVAALLAQGGQPEYFDPVERYLRNYISNLQFIITPDFVRYYKERNKTKSEHIEECLQVLNRFQGGIIGGSGLNDYHNDLLGGVSGFEMFGCCAPEGMRAIYTTWTNVIARYPVSRLGPAGVYVNLSFCRESPWGRVVSFFPDNGRLTVKSYVEDHFFLRPPSWAPRTEVRAFRNSRPVPVEWSGAYVKFADVSKGEEPTIAYPLVGFRHSVSGLWSKAADLTMTFDWLGNMVVRADPPARMFPLFTGKPRQLPSPPI